jgi:cellulose synthase/poly-beta-1,6-N-acetylglucosamine synthase-like glycosyltransferase
VTALIIAFWVSAGLLAYAQLGYALLLALLVRFVGRPAAEDPVATVPEPAVSVIVAAYAEQEVIAGRVSNLHALDYPRDRLEVIVACDGSLDETAERARRAGADQVLALSRQGKVRTQDAGVKRARGEIVAFSDANTRWETDALRALVSAFRDPRVGYACGQVRLLNEQGTNQEGLYWRYEMWIRTLESRMRSITAGNGAIYATRRESYLESDGIMGHDLGFPFNMVKRGWRAVYVPEARSTEKMVHSIDGEFSRKRRMASQTWRTTLRCGMLSPRGYDPLYALMIFSHRFLRYATPFLHVVVLATNLALLGHGWVYVAALVGQVTVIVAALLASLIPLRPLLVARYYIVTTASLAAGLWDWVRRGAPTMWDAIEGTR